MSTTRTRTAKPDSSAVQSVAGKRKRVVSDTKTKTKSKPETEDEARPTKRGKEDAPKPKPKAIPLAKRTQPTAKSPTQRETGAGTDHRVRKADLATSLLQPASHPRPSRQVFVFGNGDMGQFGLGTETLGDIMRPRLHKWFEAATKGGLLGGEEAGVEKVCVGGMHSLALDEAGRIWSWGINDNASLGRPTVNVPDPQHPEKMIESEILETQPMLVQTLVDEQFRAVGIAAGDSISVAIGETGELKAWGSFRSSDGLLGFTGLPMDQQTQFMPVSIKALEKSRFVSVACGNDHVVALSRLGHVWCFGNGQQAQLGRKIIERRKTHGLNPETLNLKKVVLIGSGSFHSFAVQQDGTVYAWGLNTLHQTGVETGRGGHEDIIITPTEVPALSPKSLGGRRVVQIAGGEHHSLFLLSDGSVWGCGRTDGYELGLPKDHPAMKDILEERKANGNIDKPLSDERIDEPVPLVFPPPPTENDPAPPIPPFKSLPDPYTKPPLEPIASLSAGTRHNLAVSVSGNVYAWGSGNTYQLGLGPDVESAPVPTRVRSKQMNDYKIEAAAAGGQHCLLVATRRV